MKPSTSNLQAIDFTLHLTHSHPRQLPYLPPSKPHTHMKTPLHPPCDSPHTPTPKTQTHHLRESHVSTPDSHIPHPQQRGIPRTKTHFFHPSTSLGPHLPSYPLLSCSKSYPQRCRIFFFEQTAMCQRLNINPLLVSFYPSFSSFRIDY